MFVCLAMDITDTHCFLLKQLVLLDVDLSALLHLLGLFTEESYYWSRTLRCYNMQPYLGIVTS